jgi:hypothetical protein
MNKKKYEELAKEIGSITNNSEVLYGGSRLAKLAVESLLGKKTIYELVDLYIASTKSMEMAKSIVQLLDSKVAMDYCFTIYTKAKNLNQKRMSVELLTFFNTDYTLKWFETFILDEDSEIQRLAGLLLKNLVLKSIIDKDECEPYLELLKQQNTEYSKFFITEIDNILSQVKK